MLRLISLNELAVKHHAVLNGIVAAHELGKVVKLVRFHGSHKSQPARIYSQQQLIEACGIFGGFKDSSVTAHCDYQVALLSRPGNRLELHIARLWEMLFQRLVAHNAKAHIMEHRAHLCRCLICVLF